MKAVWFRPEHHRDPSKKQDYEAAIRNSRLIVDRLLEILEQRMEQIENTEMDIDTYDGGAAFKLAFINGRKKELKETADLFSFINDKN
jgi:hypothetical protein